MSWGFKSGLGEFIIKLRSHDGCHHLSTELERYIGHPDLGFRSPEPLNQVKGLDPRSVTRRSDPEQFAMTVRVRFVGKGYGSNEWVVVAE